MESSAGNTTATNPERSRRDALERRLAQAPPRPGESARAQRRLVRATDDEASGANPIVSAVFSALSRLERLLLRRFDLPFGLSIALVRRVPEPSG